MIRSSDLRPGDVLIDAAGNRYRLFRRNTLTWAVERDGCRCIRHIWHIDIDEDTPELRTWWLDDCVAR